MRAWRILGSYIDIYMFSFFLIPVRNVFRNVEYIARCIKQLP
jgi:hypothetical protein